MPFCRHLLEDPRALLCPDCQRELPWLTGTEGERKVDFTGGCLSPLAYRGRVPEAVQRFKFSGVRSYAKPFGLLMAQCAQDRLKETPDLLTWAPLSRKRLRERGYDQAELLARTAGRRWACLQLRCFKSAATPSPSPAWRRRAPAGPTRWARMSCSPAGSWRESGCFWWTTWSPRGPR